MVTDGEGCADEVTGMETLTEDYNREGVKIVSSNRLKF